MNIFYLHKIAKICAQHHCDKHVVKMILELTQLLYTACWYVWYEVEEGIEIEDRTQKVTYKPNTKAEPEWIQTAPLNKSGKHGYKPTHFNHPCAIWTRESLENYQWLCNLALELCYEYTHRYGKKHVCQEHIEWLNANPPPAPSEGLTEMKQAMPDKYKVEGDPIQAYRNYYIGDKASFAKWTKRDVPDWFKPPKITLTKKLVLKHKAEADPEPVKLSFKSPKKILKLSFKK